MLFGVNTNLLRQWIDKAAQQDRSIAAPELSSAAVTVSPVPSIGEVQLPFQNLVRGFDSGDQLLCIPKRLESNHRIFDSLHGPVVLLDDGVGSAVVNGNLLR